METPKPFHEPMPSTEQTVFVPEAIVKQESQPYTTVKEGFISFVPPEFQKDPFHYFDAYGTNIKQGEPKYDETGRLREDPTAVKDLPDWHTPEGETLHVVGKKVNVNKAEIGKSGDPLYEYRIMERVQKLGLPTPQPIAHAEQGDDHLLVMERAQGIRWSEREQLKDLAPEEIDQLLRSAEEKMVELERQFNEAGILRSWKLKDMVIDIDLENKVVRNITPTDWERTTIDEEKYRKALVERIPN